MSKKYSFYYLKTYFIYLKKPFYNLHYILFLIFHITTNISNLFILSLSLFLFIFFSLFIYYQKLVFLSFPLPSIATKPIPQSTSNLRPKINTTKSQQIHTKITQNQPKNHNKPKPKPITMTPLHHHNKPGNHLQLKLSHP